LLVLSIAQNHPIWDLRRLPDHAEPQIGSRWRRKDPRPFEFHLLIDERHEKAQALSRQDRGDANVDLINQPDS